MDLVSQRFLRAPRYARGRRSIIEHGVVVLEPMVSRSPLSFSASPWWGAGAADVNCFVSEPS